MENSNSNLTKDVDPRRKTGRIVGINGRFTHSCLALFYVRNELQLHCPGLATEIVQFTINDNYYEMLLRLTNGNPEYIFFSAAIWNSSLIEKLTIDLQSALPACRIIIGGPQASVLADRIPGSACTIVIGEIEAVDKQFYSDLMELNLLSRYRGTFFKMNKRGFSYPYLDGDFDYHLKNRHVYYESSKGCPFSCTYCLSSAEKGVFHKDIELVKTELRHILSHHPKVVRFIDRTYNDIPERALAIWEFLRLEGGDTLFHFEMAPDRFTEEMFVFLKTLEHGKFQFEIGIQSTHKKTLEAVRRTVKQEVVHSTISRLASLGNIHLHVDLILGLPFENAETFAQSFRDVFRMGAHYIQMGLLKILPDTAICHGALDHGYVHSKEPPYSILATKWMDHATLSKLYWLSECVEKFVNNRYFVSLWQYLAKQDEDIYLFFEKLLQICIESGFFQLAATHELMSEKLITLMEGRKDQQLIVELLRYDWLRCNHRFLPECLKVEVEKESIQEIRSSLYQSLPQEIEGVYGRNNRNQFFRKSYFLRISKNSALQIGKSVDSDHPCLCFLAEREGGLHNFNKVLVF
ncbi:MAG: DUF4080 domain-containing protein [Desulfobulbaceae bacterium]|nr:DUF4080 domain-containing protein [Desulfobulbaceae bacterium]